LKIKICGITNKADAVGLVFYRGSKRFISPEVASEIIKELSPFTVKVGVFVNEQPEIINEISKKLKINVVQLHGDESPEVVSKINLPVIKCFRVKNGFDFSVLEKYNNASFLLDSFSETEFGGTGKIFKWSLIPDYLRNKIILSGGISVKNIETIYKNIKPAAVDLSSSLELEPGKKDKRKVEEFFQIIKYLRSKNGNYDET
jgi:phosphoribosylanthranilate isomerase